MTFNDEQYEFLRVQAEWFFKSAIYNNTIRSAPRAVTEMVARTYEDATGSKLSHNWSCAGCVMNLYRLVGDRFFKDKEEREKQQVKENERLREDTSGSGSTVKDNKSVKSEKDRKIKNGSTRTGSPDLRSKKESKKRMVSYKD